MTREQLLALGQRVLQMTTVDIVDVRMIHTAKVVTRFANDRILFSDDGDMLFIEIRIAKEGPPFYTMYTNQLDDRVLEDGVRQCESLLRAGISYQLDSGMRREPTVQDAAMPVQLWHESTVRAMTATRGVIIPELLRSVTGEQLRAAGFLGFMARATATVSKEDGTLFFGEETDCEVTVTARGHDEKSSGWGGRAARDWSTIDYTDIARHAVEMAKRGANPVAIEPGRRTAVLTPAAMVQLFRYMAGQFDANRTDSGMTALSKAPYPLGGNKLRQRIVDPRLTMASTPADPDGGYQPFFESGVRSVATPSMTWIEHGILTNLAYDVSYAMSRGKAYAWLPESLRLSGGIMTIEQMISQCKEGIFVNRFSDIDLIDEHTGLMTGVTRDGCFLIKNGKITKGIKNFRFLESPFFFLNRVEALGVPQRAAFGYTPANGREWWTNGEWPRPPIIAPPMMVRDFNFSALADAI